METRRYLVDPALPEGEAAAWAPYLTVGWERTFGGDWDLYLAGRYPPASFYASLDSRQRVSRFPGIGALAIKGDLYQNVRAARGCVGEGGALRYHPRSFLMPDDREAWLAAAATEPETIWLLKPQASACGRGIALLTHPDQAPRDGDWMVQEYVAHPHLLDGYKYALRFYLLLTSLDPLICYMHQVGTCRFATRPYTLEPAARGDPFVHLTNTSIQQRNSEVVWWQRNMDLADYRQRLRADGIDDDRLVSRVREAVIHTIIACREQALIESRAAAPRLENCFEFLSADVQVDQQMRPWILECNAAPPMEAEPGYDEAATARSDAVKGALIGDLMSLMGFSRPPLDPVPDDPARYWLERAAFEAAGANGWQRLWPGPDADRFVDAFPMLRPLDRLLASRACPAISESEPPIRVSPDVDTHTLGDALALYEPRRRRIYALNGTAAVVWLGLGEGLTTERIVDEIADAWGGMPKKGIDVDLWDLLAAWAQQGLLAGFERSADSGNANENDSWTLPALRMGHTLLIPIGAVDLSYLGAVTPTELPAPGVRRLALVYPGTDPAPVLAVRAPASVLDALALRVGPGLALDARQAGDLIHWLNGLETLELHPAVLPAGPRVTAATAASTAAAGSVTIAAVGDVMLGRALAGRMEQHGPGYPFERVADLLRSADVTIANLEVALTERGEAQDKPYVFRTPPRFAAGLREAGIDIVSLGNNHSGDFGRDGLDDTLAALDRLGIGHSGAGRDASAARLPAFFQAYGLRLAFLSYNDTQERVGDGCFIAARASAEAITADVRSARRDADAVVVSVHAGAEYEARPSARQRSLARAAIDAGALLVLGHHPHVLQGWERYREGLIVYSLGNFVFDLEHDPRNLTERAFESMVLYITLAEDRVLGVRAEPVRIDLREDRPRPATATEAAAIRERLEILNALARAPSDADL